MSRNSFPSPGELAARSGIQNYCVRRKPRHVKERLRILYRQRFRTSNAGLGQALAELRRLIAVQLQSIDKRQLTNSKRLVPTRVHQHRHLADFFRQFVDPASSRLNVDVTFALANEIESERVRVGFDRGERIRLVGDSTDLDANAVAWPCLTTEHPADFHSPGSITRPRTCLIWL